MQRQRGKRERLNSTDRPAGEEVIEGDKSYIQSPNKTKGKLPSHMNQVRFTHRLLNVEALLDYQNTKYLGNFDIQIKIKI